MLAHEAANWFHVVFENAAVGLAVTDRAGRFVQANDAYACLTGYSIPELSELDLQRIVHSDDRADMLCRMERMLDGQINACVTEQRYLHKNGSIIWVKNSLSLSRDKDGQPANFISICEDVTEHRLADALLTAQNLALEAIAGSAPLPRVLELLVRTVEGQAGGDIIANIMLVDETGRLLRHGAAASLPDEFIRAIDGIEIHPDVGTCSAAAARNEVVITQDIATAPSWKQIAHLPLGLGLRACWSMPICSSQGKVLGTFGTYFRECRAPTMRERQIVEGVCRTTTLALERRQAEHEHERLLHSERAARNEVERTARMKDEFLATLSHELRTPLNAIFGWVQLLQNKSDDTASVAKGIEVINRNARLQQRLMDDLLDMNRIMSGKVRLDIQKAHLPELIDAAIEAAALQAQAKRIMFHTAIDRNFEPVAVDSERLQQVIGNLLNNAIKFTPQGGHITVSLAYAAAYAEIGVADTGDGIAPEFLPHIFEKFSQADDSPGRRYGGLGLGLSIAKTLTEMHHGSLSAESQGIGLGANFTVRLPLGNVRPQAPSAASAALPSSVNEKSRELEGMKVLVVDDEADARELASQILTQAKIVTATASSADEARKLLAEFSPDVIIADIGMPGESGYDLIRSLRQDGMATTAIALSAFARPEERLLSAQAGFQFHLCKPFEQSELLAALSVIALGRGSARERF